MIWLTLRQFRLNAVVVYAALLAVAAALLLTGPHLAAVYRQDTQAFLGWISTRGTDRFLYIFGSAAGYVLPALIGAFWGAPMVARELEAGTHRLVWSQTVTRNQWLATKLGVGLLGAVTASGILGLATTWWAHPVDKAVDARTTSDVSSVFEMARLTPTLFASRGIAPIGYAAVAFAAGVLAGALIRRTVPAMAVTLAAYVVLQVLMPTLVRPHLAAPVDSTAKIAPGSIHGIMASGPDAPIERLDVGSAPAGSWVLSNETVDVHGKAVHSFGRWVTDCLGPPQTDPTTTDTPQKAACYQRLASDGYRQHLSYQPARSYWALQWRETGLLLGVAGVLVGACFWRVRRLS
ncbi:hypothetical protein ACVW00_004085 [Marmoricola sp. URHA0025 HA25]